MRHYRIFDMHARFVGSSHQPSASAEDALAAAKRQFPDVCGPMVSPIYTPAEQLEIDQQTAARPWNALHRYQH